jgi:hypothetical protein
MMNLKLNWGVKIFTVYGIFVLFMIFMVSRTMKHDVNLVSKDYYAKELVFQDQIEKINNLKNLDQKVSYKITANTVEINVPEGAVAEGELHFFRPSDPNLDVIVSLKNSETIVVPITEFKKGMYRLKADWAANGMEYYAEEIIVIP